MKEEKVKKGNLSIEHSLLEPFKVMIAYDGMVVKERSSNGRDWVTLQNKITQKPHLIHCLKWLLLNQMEGSITPWEWTELENNIDHNLNELFNKVPLPSVEEIQKTGEKIEEEILPGYTGGVDPFEQEQIQDSKSEVQPESKL